MDDYDVVILTDARYESPRAPDEYTRQVLLEDGLVATAIERCGLRVTRVDWARSDFDFGTTRTAVFRSTWDYFVRIDEFRSWLERTAASTRFVNDIALVRWNIDKRYLLDLEVRGVRIAPIRFIDRGDDKPLAEHLDASGWSEVVLKPVISGAGRETYRIAHVGVDDHEATFRRLVASEGMMLQPFQQSILVSGELYLMVIEGRTTHAVCKTASPGDFRVQDDHGGRVRPHEPAADERSFAEAAVRQCTPRPLYARVDLVRDEKGKLALMELELIEPELFFRLHTPAADILARAIAKTLDAR